MKKYDQAFAGLSEYDVKELCWQLYTFSGETYVKRDFAGNFINTRSGEITVISNLFPRIRNITDAAGYIIAKRKAVGRPLRQERKHNRVRVPKPV